MLHSHSYGTIFWRSMGGKERVDRTDLCDELVLKVVRAFPGRSCYGSCSVRASVGVAPPML